MHHRVTVLLCVILLLRSGGCVEKYYPEEDNLKTGTMVISAHINDGPDAQIIEISRSSALIKPEFDPVQGCYVEIECEDGITRTFVEEKPGYYKSVLWPDFLVTGKSYRIHISTPDDNEYESDFEKLRPVPEIDSLYYIRETMSYGTESDSLQGIRFYLDFTYDREEYEFIRWDLIETYEFHNPDMKGFILDYDLGYQPLTDTNNYRICYITNMLTEIYSMSLKTLEKGCYIMKPLNFVPNIRVEQKLHHEYSLLVRQYSISEAAFIYWNELMKTSQEAGWLFDKQPALLISNICNVNDKDEKVLGFFSMSAVKEQRAIARDIEGIDTRPYKWFCVPVDKEIGGYPPNKDMYPFYFARRLIDGVFWYGIVKKECVDCRAYKNSSHIKPDYW